MASTALPSQQPVVRVRIAVFGGLRIFVDGREVDGGPPRQRAVLAMLVAAQGRVVTVAEMLDALWGEVAPASAVNQVHRHVGNLRRLLQPELSARSSGHLILAVGNGYRLDVATLSSDLMRFGELRAETSSGDNLQQATNASLEALALAAQPAFLGLPDELRSRPAFAVIESERKAAAIHACDTVLDLDRRAAMLPHIEAIAFEHPLDEVLHARLVAMLGGLGRRSEAIADFEATRDALREELGLSPGPDLRSAYLTLLQDDELPPDDETAPDDTEARHELPPPLSSFIPRQGVQQILDSVVDSAISKGAIAVLSGMGGLGKTTLAVQWASSLSNTFKHGELYINLLGFETNREPLTTDEAMSRLLEQLGSVPAETSAARLAQYRSLIADRSLVILLDNARDAEQVRPLLTSTPGCLSIVTSRDRLSGLVVREGARSVPLRRWNASESRELLATRLGAERVRLEPAAIDSIVDSCAGLPLALAIAAARSALEPESSIPELAAQLADRASVLDVLEVGEADDLRSAFQWSYRALPPEAARMFRHLAAHPGPQISVNSLAACADRTLAETRQQIAVLIGASMTTDAASEMVSLHDLLRAYASDLVDAAGERADAEARLIDHYVRSNREAFLQSGREPTVELPATHRSGESVEHFNSPGDAFDWYSREREP